MNFLKRHLNIAYEIKETQRREILEIPEVALREAIVNAVAHRDYFEKGANVMVEIYDNRVEISDPGGLPKGLKPENFGKYTLARNALIAALLHRAGYIEKLGTGILRIRNAMVDAKLPEPEFEFDGFFTIVLARPKQAATKKIIEDLAVSPAQQERMKALLQHLYEKNKLDVAAIAKKFDTTVRTIQRDLQVLNEKGWISFSGSARSRIYQLTETALMKLSDSNALS